MQTAFHSKRLQSLIWQAKVWLLEGAFKQPVSMRILLIPLNKHILHVLTTQDELLHIREKDGVGVRLSAEVLSVLYTCLNVIGCFSQPATE